MADDDDSNDSAPVSEHVVDPIVETADDVTEPAVDPIAERLDHLLATTTEILNNVTHKTVDTTETAAEHAEHVVEDETPVRKPWTHRGWKGNK